MMGSVECKRWFVPAVTSIGPLHFRCSDGVGVVSMGAVARIKEEAISFIMEKYGDAERPKIMESLISDIRGHEQKIKACYSDGTRIPVFLSGDRFAWMMVVDACYLLVALSVLSRETIVESKRWPALALLQGDGYRRQKVVHDLFKIENQIPLWVVKLVARHLPGWEPIANGELSQLVDMQKVLQRLCPFSIHDRSDIMLTLFSELVLSRWRRCYNNDREGTLLDLLLLFSLGETTEERKALSPASGRTENFKWKVFGELVEVMGCPIRLLLALLHKILKNMELGSLTAQSVLPGYHSRMLNLVANLVTRPVQGIFFVLAMVLVAMGTVLLALVALPFMAVASIWQPRSSVHAVNLRAHAIVESGVKINMSTSALGIQSAVYWREEGGQLGLPRTRVDELAMVALWNMVALEQLHPELANRGTLSHYVCLMSDLLGSTDDVMHLENEQIIEDVASSCRHDVVQMWQDLKLLATTSSAKGEDMLSNWDMETYEAGIQLAHASLSEFVESRQRLWYAVRRPESWLSLLRSQYGSSPWLAISTVGAIALLLMSVVQVFCLFYKCPGTKG